MAVVSIINTRDRQTSSSQSLKDIRISLCSFITDRPVCPTIPTIDTMILSGSVRRITASRSVPRDVTPSDGLSGGVFPAEVDIPKDRSIFVNIMDTTAQDVCLSEAFVQVVNLSTKVVGNTSCLLVISTSKT